MPPIPTPRTKPAKARRQPSASSRERESAAPGNSSARPAGTSRSRPTKNDKLQEQIEKAYIVLGTAIRPFGRFYPVMTNVGDNLKSLSGEAAEAWMELGEKDKRVIDWWESIVSASAIGNVIGVHFAIFADALPMGQFVQALNTDDDTISRFYQEGKEMGMSEQEIAEAIARANGQIVTPDMPARDMSAGGPGDTIRTGGESVSSGIVTPDQLGVTQPGQAGAFPADASPPNGSGKVDA